MDKNNAVVMWGGKKNGGKNKTQKGLLQIKNFVENYNQDNIIVLSIPHRYDLQINSLVNNYMKVFNRKLREHWKIFDNAFLVKVNLDTDQFTRHGLNLNSWGKKTVNKENDMLLLYCTVQHNSNMSGNRHINKARRHNLNTQTHAVTTPNIEY